MGRCPLQDSLRSHGIQIGLGNDHRSADFGDRSHRDSARRCGCDRSLSQTSAATTTVLWVGISTGRLDMNE